jgi:hypothetical protein
MYVACKFDANNYIRKGNWLFNLVSDNSCTKARIYSSYENDAAGAITTFTG